MSQAKQFVQDLFKNEKSKETHVKIVDESTKQSQNSYKRANTNVGVMNKFILQFSRVEKAYRLVEDAFILIARSEKQQTLQERMKRKCKMQSVKPILTHLGFGDDCFTNDEIKEIFDKSPVSDQHLSFQRLLIGVGISYFAKLEKEKVAEEKENSGTEVEYNDDGTAKKKEEVVLPDDDNNNNDDDDDIKQSEEDQRMEILAAGFIVVKKMFDVIDEDGSGEISLQEFEQSFNDICRDPDIVKQRMKELDYNNDQNISFREFIFGISSWCGFNDEMIMDDNDNDLDKAAPPSPTKKNDNNNNNNNNNNDNQ